LRLIEVVVDPEYAGEVERLAEEYHVSDYWTVTTTERGRQTLRMLVARGKLQPLLDALQEALPAATNPRLVILPVEAVRPRPPVPGPRASRRSRFGAKAGTTREELYDHLERGATLDGTFLLLVALSTIVSTIGLNEDNVAAVIGGMVIAPLLGPNMALALGTALGETHLMGRALQSSLVGLGLTVALALAIGQVWPVNLDSHELLTRTDVGLSGVALALASGSAAVLSLTTGLSSVLVGVMVAAALLPPAAALGLTLGSGYADAGLGAGLLLAVNLVCVNLAAKVTFWASGISPATHLERRRANQSMILYILLWVLSLAILVGAIYVRGRFLGAS